jgi:homoprotocatechuate degradation regulator HpaR
VQHHSIEHYMSKSTIDASGHRNLPMLLLSAREKTMARFRPLIAAHGLTEQQWRVIRVLNESGPLEPREISVLCMISSPSMAGVLGRMEALGFVTKERFADDRRRVLVTLTATSINLVRGLTKKLEVAYRDIERAIGVDVVAQLYLAIDAFLTGFELVALRQNREVEDVQYHSDYLD